MDWQYVLILQLGLLLVLIVAGVPVVIAFFALNIVGAWIFLGDMAGLQLLVSNSFDSVTKFSLVPIPLFILMGEILYHSGVAVKAVDAVDKLISKVPGRLSLVSIVSGTIFSALSGSSIANAAMLGSTVLPEMTKRGYHPVVSVGPILATGGIAALIPPSGLAVLLGSLAEIPIAELLMGGIVPGILMAVLFFVYVVIRCLINPSLAPTYDIGRLTFRQRFKPIVIYVVPLSILIFAVIGTMIFGIASPNESSAFGVLGAVVVAAFYRGLSRKVILASLRETAKISGMILFILTASITFSQILAFSGATQGFLNFVKSFDLSSFELVIAIIFILLFLGCFVDQVSMMMITLPFFMPLAKASGIDVIWLGVIMLIMLEAALITPPFGILLFVMKGVAPEEITMGDIAISVIPYLLLTLLTVALVVMVPSIATWLPAIVQR